MARIRSDDHDLHVMAAWLYYVHGLGQEEVARRLEVSRTKVVRMLSSARESGLVKISLEHQMAETLALGDWIAASYGLGRCILTPPADAANPDDPLLDPQRKDAVGIAAANYIGRRILNTRNVSVGVGGGTTVRRTIDAMRVLSKPDSRVVALMGASHNDDGTSAYSLSLEMAQIVGGTARTLPIPFVLGLQETCAALKADPYIRPVLAEMASTDFNVISCGGCDETGSFFMASGISAEDLKRAREAGAVCEVAGHFLKADGSRADTELNDRHTGIEFEDLQKADNVVVAAGTAKTKPLLALLQAGIATTLVIDHSIATGLVAARPKSTRRPPG
ncbi:sugar-binding transcriptional regulator [Affinirhizobium pseudoryzae]|uniref:sugar-binding transcriptional regulator n=1 Tax=Allorhizobium pseudoryzae TaxID=379684 RepID=UPI0013EBEF9C|nr:sugar-binding domain-containing protein [Allorhizobium pseudoryzae]